ncbi:hypothetical protein JCM4914_23700 [Streptomyces platensis subsp. malvinus]
MALARSPRLPAPSSRLPAPGSRLPAPGSRLPAPGSRLPAAPYPAPSCARKGTVTLPVLNRGRGRAWMRAWEAAKCDRKINCQWVRLRSKAWVTHTCANSRPR